MKKIDDDYNPQKWIVTLVHKNNPKEVIFAIPRTTDQNEKEEMLKEQILDRLCYFYEDIFFDAPTEEIRKQMTIKEVQGYLRALCNHLPREKAWIVKVSDDAGKKFLDLIKQKINGNDIRTLLNTIQKGEMPFRVHSIK